MQPSTQESSPNKIPGWGQLWDLMAFFISLLYIPFNFKDGVHELFFLAAQGSWCVLSQRALSEVCTHSTDAYLRNALLWWAFLITWPLNQQQQQFFLPANSKWKQQEVLLHKALIRYFNEGRRNNTETFIKLSLVSIQRHSKLFFPAHPFILLFYLWYVMTGLKVLAFKKSAAAKEFKQPN